ncbi:MAG: hypothetical protein JWQ76_4669, partial [Ramlibacter sp.]|nr:hypothetical protein [Ramlibacter sp.]
ASGGAGAPGAARRAAALGEVIVPSAGNPCAVAMSGFPRGSGEKAPAGGKGDKGGRDGRKPGAARATAG